jgi:lycopene beta-cyclase
MTNPLSCDIAIVGGGLSGGLIARALKHKRPDLDVRLIEAEDRLGGNHIWSFFDSDISESDRWLIAPLVCHRWDAYDVAFPAYRRTLDAAYNSIESATFNAFISEELGPDRLVHGEAVSVGADHVTLSDQRTYRARAVIDARGPGDLATLDLGWQKFMGQTLRIVGGHGLSRPVVMDATVDQLGGYRFVYCLPFSPDTVFVEDTYYSDGAALDLPALRARITDYARGRGWTVEAVESEETGVLPVALGGDFDAYWASSGEGTSKAGMRAALFHPTTGYSLPDAVRLASLLATVIDPADFASAARGHAEKAWKSRGFYRLLDLMLFRAAAPEDRYKILERFYRLSPSLIGRFYAAQSTFADKARILSGKPPVSVIAAIRAIMESRN